MTRLNKTLMAITLSLAATAPAFAGHAERGDRIGERLERQQNRIEHGIENRELTRKEARVLKQQQRKIRRLAREFRDDGRLSKKERRILRAKLDRASERIWEFKHSDRSRRDRGHHHDRFVWNDSDWNYRRHSHDW
jgi:uncharacterized protein HemX